jgi:peroxisomal enoyl-CoA hydratase 2
MSGPGAGFEYPPKEVSWLKRDVLLFANSIGCTDDELHFLYVPLPYSQAPYLQFLITKQELHPNFSVFPTYPIILRRFSPSSPPQPLPNISQHSKAPPKK